jgi:hypothetical protein
MKKFVCLTLSQTRGGSQLETMILGVVSCPLKVRQEPWLFWDRQVRLPTSESPAYKLGESRTQQSKILRNCMALPSEVVSGDYTWIHSREVAVL